MKRGGVRTRSSPAGPAEQEEGGSLQTDRLAWRTRKKTNKIHRDCRRSPAMAVGLGAAVVNPAQPGPTMSGQSNAGTLQASRRGGGASGRRAKGISREDIPAEVGEFLVNTLQRHVWMCGIGGCQRSATSRGWGAAEFKAVSALPVEGRRIGMNQPAEPRYGGDTAGCRKKRPRELLANSKGLPRNCRAK